MINVTKLNGNASNVIRYVREKIEQHMSQKGEQYTTGYYMDGAPSEWSGELAAELGLSGEVNNEDFKKLLEGKTPDGQSFAKERPDRRLGVDLTFSAPKSVSIEALANGNDQIKDFHKQAVEYALGYVESDVVSARYGKDGVRSEKTQNAIFAKFTHENARPVGGQTEPTMHDHVIVLNATRGENGQIRALDLDFGPESVRMHTLDALYKAKYAELLESSGFETRQTQHGFELAHISDEQIANHSDRSHQIENYLAENGKSRETTTGAERSAANLATRSEKATLPQHELLTQWRTAARNEGIIYAENATSDQLSIDFDNPDATIKAARSAVDQALDSQSERDAVLSREKVMLEAVQTGIGQTSPEKIRDALDNHEGVYAVGTDQIVTQKALDREREIMDAAAQGRDQHDPIYTPDDAQAQITQHEQQTGIEYSQGQRDALALALTSTDQTTGIVGAAGAGKTTAMAALSSEATTAGYAVVGLAPSKVASDALKEAGITDTQTLASWHGQERDPNDPARYIVIDESGMVSDRDMQELYNGLRPQDRLLLVGDPRQLQPVEAGSSYSEMLRTGAIQYARIDEIRRQRDPRLLEMTRSFARGDTEAATAIAMEYSTTVEPERNKDGKVTLKERRDAISDETARRYLALDQQKRADTVVLSGTNETRSQINAKIRNGLIAEGVVDNDNAQSVTSLQKTRYTKSQLEQARYYEPGQVVAMHERREKRQYTIESVDTRANTITMRDQQTGENRTENAERIQQRGQLYNPTPIDLGAGDQVIFNENDPEHDLRNGDTGRVTSIDDQGAHITLDRLDNGDPVNITIDAEQGAAIDYSYARTVHKSQGLTEGRVIVAGETTRGTTAEQGYVATSRERDALDIITDDTERLSKNWQKEADKQTARSAVANATQIQEGAAREQAREQAAEDTMNNQRNSAKELAQFKKWDLARHMERDGYQRDDRESSQGYAVMRRDDEKLIVTERDGNQIYSDAHDSSNAGTIIDYEKHEHGRSIGETRQHLRELDNAPEPERPERRDEHRAQAPERDTEAVAERYNNYDSYKHEGSYLERRGIDADTVQAFDVRQDDRSNAIFRHRDLENNTVGYELKNDEFAGFSAGGERSLNMEKIGESDDISRVVITESAIDSMSHYQAHRDEIDRDDAATVYISTGGAMKQSQLDDIHDVVRRTGADEVRLAHDADESGNQMAARLRDHLNDTRAEIERDKPEAGKDWNESLQAEQQAERDRATQAQADQERQEQEAQAEQERRSQDAQAQDEREPEQQRQDESEHEQKQEQEPERSQTQEQTDQTEQESQNEQDQGDQQQSELEPERQQAQELKPTPEQQQDLDYGDEDEMSL